MPNAAVSGKVHSEMRNKSVNGRSQLLEANSGNKPLLMNHQMKCARDNESNKTITGKKRASEGVLDCRERKKLKLDCITTSRCQSLLLKLMKHKYAKPFLNPVNPTEWGIPDYFDIIKHPMDLGTIDKNLHRNEYANVEEFEADVRLTFSNAMLYNPSNNWVHQHAKRLGEIFDSEWKSVKAILFRDLKNIMKNRAENGTDVIVNDVRSKCREGNSSAVVDVPKNTMLCKGNSSEEIKITSFEVRKCREGNSSAVVDVPKNTMLCKGNSSEEIKITSFEVGLKCRKGNSSVVVDVPKNTMLCKRNSSEEIKITSFGVRHSDVHVASDHKAKGCNQLRSSQCSAAKDTVVGHVSHRDKESACSMSRKATCGSTNVVKAPTESHSMEVKSTPTVQTTKSDQESEGDTSCLDEEHAAASKTVTVASVGSTTRSLDTVLDMQLSTSQALRAAKLRSRFADTILKAQTKTLLQQGGEMDAETFEQEKEKLLRKHQEERAKIEAQVRAADLAARLKADNERKKQRQQAREAARAALEQMERSIDLDDNFRTNRDLEALIGCSSYVVCHDSRSRRVRTPVERLGLYLKAEYRVGDEDYDILPREMDLEEGELPS
ncbi:hypothetical protein RND81_07G158900 [Saponaria officinalis]